jgi:hypothetical protein
MRRAVTALCLAVFAVTFVACGARLTPPSGPGAGGNQPTVEVTAAQLAQDFTDDYEAANTRYVDKTLVISGTVGRLTKPGRYDQDPGPNDDVDMVLFFVPVTSKKTGQQVRYELRCQFRPSLPAQQRRALGLEQGRRVTLRGRYEVGYRDQPLVGLGNCTIVSVGGE